MLRALLFFKAAEAALSIKLQLLTVAIGTSWKESWSACGRLQKEIRFP
uniref:Uncharacterized protein n=1 Tax=Arundo donax TaxID=35708 RepID=A0A0A9DGP5_ARUDO